MPYALDESLDDGSWSLGPAAPLPAHLMGSSGSGSGSMQGPAEGLVALVVKPARWGGIEAALGLAAAAARQGIQVGSSGALLRVDQAAATGGRIAGLQFRRRRRMWSAMCKRVYVAGAIHSCCGRVYCWYHQ